MLSSSLLIFCYGLQYMAKTENLLKVHPLFHKSVQWLQQSFLRMVFPALHEQRLLADASVTSLLSLTPQLVSPLCVFLSTVDPLWFSTLLFACSTGLFTALASVHLILCMNLGILKQMTEFQRTARSQTSPRCNLSLSSSYLPFLLPSSIPFLDPGSPG